MIELYLIYTYLLITMTFTDMSSNHLIRNIYEALSKLVALRYLVLCNNMIDGGISPYCGRKLRTLESLETS